MAKTLGTGNILDLQGATTGAAFSKFITRTATNRVHHVVDTEEIQRTAIEVSRGTDAKFPPDGIVVEERGYLRITTRRTDSGAVENVQQLQLDDRYLVREEDGLFRIADWDLVQNPVAVIPAVSPLVTPVVSPSPTATPRVAGPAAVGTPSHTGPAVTSGGAGAAATGTFFGAVLAMGLLMVGVGGFGLILTRRGRSLTTGLVVEDEQNDEQPTAPWLLRIRTMGRLEVREGQVDHTKDLLQHPVQSFLWLYLLVLAVDGERPRKLRELVAEAMWPKQSMSTRNQRMRGRLSQRKRMLAPILADRIVDDGETLEFDLDDCWVDAIEVIRLARASALDPDLQSPPLRSEVAALLEVARGQFLEFWEELEARAIEGDDESTTRSFVDEVRGRVERCRVDLLLAMARNSLWRNEAREAIPFLEEAIAVRPDRDDVRGSLIDAYERGGRESEARRLKEFP